MLCVNLMDSRCIYIPKIGLCVFLSANFIISHKIMTEYNSQK